MTTERTTAGGPAHRLVGFNRINSSLGSEMAHWRGLSAGFWAPEADVDVDKALHKGEPKFTLAGKKLKGSWVLVRMRNDHVRGKRNNWLLIKQGDRYEHKDDDDTVLDQGTSVASGRTMDQIAAEKVEGPSHSWSAGARSAIRAASGTRTATSKELAANLYGGRRDPANRRHRQSALVRWGIRFGGLQQAYERAKRS
jgi:bifunctional non-homologous end joining protein LigD